MNQLRRMLIVPPVVFGVLPGLLGHVCDAAEETSHVAAASGVPGGLAVHVGAADAEFLLELGGRRNFVVQGLDVAADRVHEARETLLGRGSNGRVTARVFAGRRLPYVDCLVNLLVISDGLEVPGEELTRVLAPRGAVIAREPLADCPEGLEVAGTTPEGWTRYRKLVPDSIDEWGHYLHAADNNALSHDTLVGPPRHMQWLSGPRWTRHHDTDKGTYPTIRAVVSAAGRLYYLLDETPSSNMKVPSRWVLVARDAYSGVQLWKRRVETESYPRELEQVWRQTVADGQYVYAQLAAGGALSRLDGATGEVLQTYAGSEGFREVIKEGDDLFFVGPESQVFAVSADSGRMRWGWDPGPLGPIVRLTLAAAQGRVFVKTAEAACCLSAADGETLWTRTLPQAEKPVLLRWPRERLIVARDVVLVSFGGKDPTDLNRDSPEFLGSHPRVRDYAGRLAALDAATGRKLWESGYMPNLESAPGELYVRGNAVWLGPDFAEARDLRTGEPQPGLDGVLEQLWTDGHHHRCYPGKATSRYLLTGKRGVEFFDTVGDNHSRNNWVRSTCRVGVTPCNGLLYASPHSCGCYPEAQINGFWALAAREARDWGPEDEVGERLERGPAFAESAVPPDPLDAAAWPTYRGENTRSGSSQAAVPADLQSDWSVAVGGRLSPLTVAGGQVYVAQTDQHCVHALDAESGRRVWHFTAGGRVDSPPTFHRGLVLFGARDGCVYCLRARDGRLVWRFQAAPRDFQAVAGEQLESLWPVNGSVLVRGDAAYVAAGRSSHLDGGIQLYALDSRTGRVLHRRRLASPHPGLLEPPPDAVEYIARNQQNWEDYKTQLAADHSDSFTMQGARVDVISGDGQSVYMRQLRFAPDLSPQMRAGQHLFSTSNLLDDSEHHRAYWILGTGDFSGLPVAFPWIAGRRLQVPFGVMLAFDRRNVWSVLGGAGRRGLPPEYRLVCLPRPDPAGAQSALPDFAERGSAGTPSGSLRRRGSGERRAQDSSRAVPVWQHALRARPRALIQAGGQLFVGGMRDAGYDTALDDWQAGRLTVFASRSGRVLHSIELDAPPVWDGLAAANGRVYAALENGWIVSLAE